MKQSAFDAFYFKDEIPLAPIQQGGSLRSRHASAMGALSADEVVARQMLRVLAVYQQWGPLCDQEVAMHAGLERSTVIPRRHELMKRGLVQEVGFTRNPKSGKNNTAYDMVGR